MISKEINAYGRKLIIACDNKCEKAFGINSRPSIQLDQDNDDDVAWLADNEVGIAPIDPETYEGGVAKPKTDDQKLNKWCFRECERCSQFEVGEDIKLTDYSVRVYNIPR